MLYLCNLKETLFVKIDTKTGKEGIYFVEGVNLRRNYDFSYDLEADKFAVMFQGYIICYPDHYERKTGKK